MLQPQSDEEIRPVVEALRRLDPLLDIKWNPKARMVRAGSYDSCGGIRHDPTYEGLFEVIRYNTPGLTDRGYVVLCRVTRPTRFGRKQLLMMEADGPYAPIQEWLVEYMRTWDAAQRHFATVMEERAREDERVEDLTAVINDRAAHQEALEKIYAEYGDGPYYAGKGFGKGPRRTLTAAETN